jgi:methionine biosynthesis protein MetW
MISGRAPVTSALPYAWYDTPNLHFMTLSDFRDLVDVVHGRIVEELPLVAGRPLRSKWLSNLRADSALYVVERQQELVGQNH